MEDMSNWRGSDHTVEAMRTRKRSRRSKAKTSNLSARLNPDFDPKDFMTQNSCTLTLNPDAMSFESLVEMLQSSFILDHLHKILTFLRYDGKELRFAHLIAPYKEAFLVKIAQNNSYLKANVFNEVNSKLAKDILDVVENHKTEYKWTYSYEKGPLNRNVLVYKKVFLCDMQNGECKDGCLQQGSEISLASSFMNMSLTNIAPNFKITMLNTTLKFIKDPTRLTLEYPEMTVPQGQFVYNLILSPKRPEDVGLGFKSMYSSLYETIEGFERKYRFDISFMKSSNISTIKLLLNKIPKSDAVEVQNKIIDDNKSISVSPLTNSTTSLLKSSKSTPCVDKGILSKQRIVQAVPEPFLRNSLERFLEFVKDASSANLEYKDVDLNKSKFLECMTTLSKKQEYYKLFSGVCVVLLKRVCRAAKQRGQWDLQLSVGKTSRRTGLRTITFYKTPNFGSKNESLDEKPKPSRSFTDPSKAEKMAIALDIPLKKDLSYTAYKSSNKEEISNVKVGCYSEEKRSVDCRNEEKRLESVGRVKTESCNKEEVSKEINQKSSRQFPAISFRSAGALAMDTAMEKTGTGIEEGAGRGASAPPASRKGRLLKALNTPLECDRAERMMRMMGWQGGALGAREGGLIEPIIPVLHLTPGAGLGHVKQVSRSIAEFRMSFLQSLLTLVTSDAQDTAVTFASAMTKREVRFLQPTVEALNRRKRISLKNLEESDVVKSITEELMRNHSVHIGLQISKDNRELHLTKVKILEEQNGTKKQKTKPSDPNDVSTDSDVMSISKITLDVEASCPTKRSARTLACKLKFLGNIRDFLIDGQDVAEYKFDCNLSKKQKSYVQAVITSVNKGKAVKNYSEIENEFCREILKLVDEGYVLSVAFGPQKFILTKKFYTKQLTNTALKPPKSTDVENTIIYINNVAIPADQYNEHIGKLTRDTTSGRDRDDAGRDDVNGITSYRDRDVTSCDDANDTTSYRDHNDTSRDDVNDATSYRDRHDTNSDDGAKAHEYHDNSNDIEVDNDNMDYESDDLIDTDLDDTKDSIILDTSNDSLTLDELERENNAVGTNYELTGTVCDKFEFNLKNEVNNNHNVDKDTNCGDLSSELSSESF